MWRTYLVLLADLQRALSRRLDKLHAAGVPRTWREVIPPPIPDQDNAAVLYEQAFSTLNFDVLGNMEDRDLLNRFVTDSSPRSREKARPEVRLIIAANQAALTLVKQGAARPRCRFAIDWDELPPLVLYPQFAHARVCVRMLAADALLAAEEGDGQRAIESYRSAVRMSAHVASEPAMIAFLASAGMQRFPLSILPDVLAQMEVKPSVCYALWRDLESLDYDTSFRRGVAVEAYVALWLFETADRRPGEFTRLLEEPNGLRGRAWLRAYLSPVWRLGRLREEIGYAEVLQTTLDICGKPYRLCKREADAAQRQANSARSYQFVSNVWRFHPAPLVIARDRAVAVRNAMQVALALEAYHTARGAYPDSLDALREYPGWTLHEDPFSGKPFVYHRQGAGFVLYSFGEDLDDDGGIPGQAGSGQGDLVWECKS